MGVPEDVGPIKLIRLDVDFYNLDFFGCWSNFLQDDCIYDITVVHL